MSRLNILALAGALLFLGMGLFPTAASGACPARADAHAVELPTDRYLTVDQGSWGIFVRAYFVREWVETNGIGGLQRDAVACSDGRIVPADQLQVEAVVPDPRVVYGP